MKTVTLYTRELNNLGGAQGVRGGANNHTEDQHEG